MPDQLSASAVDPGNQPANILIVDDLPEKLLVYETILAPLGENLVLVSSGAQALKQVLHRQFAVILLDVNMPDMDGFETARLIRGHRRSSSTPIIFLTAFTDEVRTAEGYASGAVDYLPTPVVPQVLQAKVRVFVELFKMRTQVAQRAEEHARRIAAEESNLRLRFLSDASAVLGTSLNFHTTARALAVLPVPFLADFSLLEFGSAAATPGRHLQVRASATEPVVTECEALDDLPEIARRLSRQAFELGHVVCESCDSDPTPQDYAAIPLQARQRTIAVLVIGRARDTAGTGLDVTLAVALASRAATALDNALLHEELVKADRQKVDFLSMLAHELRNPLAPICNSVQLLRMTVTGDDGELRYVSDVIERQVSQLVRLIDDLLDVSRITSGKIRLKRQTVDLRQVASLAVEASQPLMESHGHRLTVSLPASPVSMDGDPARMTQVITNLLNNAAKYTPDGGRIQLQVTRTASEATITVRDNGIGIPREMLTSVFELFTQDARTLDRSSGGLGIGLTLVQRLVEMHGGTVQAQSAGPGQGAEFTIQIPIVGESAVSDELPLEAVVESTENPRLRILIVDDNADAADTLAMLCRLNGHQVQVAYDGASCLPIAQTFQPEIVMLDIGLPRLDGYQVAEKLRSSDVTRKALLVAISGYGQPMDEARSRSVGFDAHFVKPVAHSLLMSILQSGSGAREVADEAVHFP